jgi:hypothetical protein
MHTQTYTEVKAGRRKRARKKKREREGRKKADIEQPASQLLFTESDYSKPQQHQATSKAFPDLAKIAL